MKTFVSRKTAQVNPKYAQFGVVIFLVLLTMIACGSSTPEVPPEPTAVTACAESEVVAMQQQGEIRVNDAVFRTGPGVECDLVGSLDNQETVEVLGKTTDEEWYQIRVQGYQEYEALWISADFVRLESNGTDEDPGAGGPLAVESPTITSTGVPVVVTAIDTPTHTATLLPTDRPDTPTFTATSLPAPATPTITGTSTPPVTSSVTPSGSSQWGFENNCISAQVWTTYPQKITKTNDRGCLVISNLGFETQNERLRISVQNPGSDQRYGIYAPIRGDALIEFNLAIDDLETRADNELVSLAVGIMSMNPLNAETDGFIYYVIESPDAGYPVFLKKGERGGYDQYLEIDGGYFRYDLGSRHTLSYLLEGNRLEIYINGDLVRRTTLPFNERGFFIGYKFENLGSLDARLWDLSIQKR